MNQLQQMMAQAQKMQRELQKAQAELAKKEFSVTKAGLVTVKVLGSKEVQSISIDKDGFDAGAFGCENFFLDAAYGQNTS